MEKKFTINNALTFGALVVTWLLGAFIEDLAMRRIAVIGGCAVVVWLTFQNYRYLRQMKIEMANAGGIYEKIKHVVSSEGEKHRILVYFANDTERVKQKFFARMMTTGIADHTSKVSALLWSLLAENEMLDVYGQPVESQEELFRLYTKTLVKGNPVKGEYVDAEGYVRKTYSVTKSGELEFLVDDTVMETVEPIISAWCKYTPELKPSGGKPAELHFDRSESHEVLIEQLKAAKPLITPGEPPMEAVAKWLQAETWAEILSENRLELHFPVELKVFRLNVKGSYGIPKQEQLRGFRIWRTEENEKYFDADQSDESILVLMELESRYFEVHSSNALHRAIMVKRGISQEDYDAEGAKYLDYAMNYFDVKK